MIRICYKELGKVGFQQTFMKLVRTQMKDKAAFTISQLKRALDVGVAKMQQEFKVDGMDKYMEPGFKMGEASITGKSKELDFPFQCISGKEEEFKKFLDSFGERYVEVKANKFTPDFLFSVASWSAEEIEALSPIVADLQVVV